MGDVLYLDDYRNSSTDVAKKLEDLEQRLHAAVSDPKDESPEHLSEMILKYDASNTPALIIQAADSYKLGDFSAAVGYVDKVLETAPYDREALIIKMHCIPFFLGTDMKSFSAAEDIVRTAHEAYPFDCTVLELGLKLSLFVLQNKNLAESLYEDGMKTEPQRFSHYGEKINRLLGYPELRVVE